MANISDDIRVYVRDLIVEQLGSLDSKDMGIAESQGAEHENVFLNRWPSQPDNSHLIKDIGDE